MEGKCVEYAYSKKYFCQINYSTGDWGYYRLTPSEYKKRQNANCNFGFQGNIVAIFKVRLKNKP